MDNTVLDNTDALCNHEDYKRQSSIHSQVNLAKAAFNKKSPFTSKMNFNLRKKLVKCYIWSIALFGGESWTLR